MKFNPARQALAKWLMTQRRCVGYPSCDGDLVGQLHDDDCPLASVKGSEGRASMVTPDEPEYCNAGPSRNIPIEEYRAVIEENEKSAEELGQKYVHEMIGNIRANVSEQKSRPAPSGETRGAVVEYPCGECGHAKSRHFGCVVGSFCKDCPADDKHTWEHSWKPLAPEATKEKSVFGSGMSGYVRVPAPEATTKEPEFCPTVTPEFCPHGIKIQSYIACGNCEAILRAPDSLSEAAINKRSDGPSSLEVAPGEAVGRGTRDVKYCIDPEAETKFMVLPGGGEISTEATECEIDLWRELSTLRRERDRLKAKLEAK